MSHRDRPGIKRQTSVRKLFSGPDKHMTQGRPNLHVRFIVVLVAIDAHAAGGQRKTRRERGSSGESLHAAGYGRRLAAVPVDHSHLSHPSDPSEGAKPADCASKDTDALKAQSVGTPGHE